MTEPSRPLRRTGDALRVRALVSWIQGAAINSYRGSCNCPACIGSSRPARRALRIDGATGKAASKQEKALRAAIAKSGQLGAVAVVIRGGQVSFGGVPLDQKALRELGRALAKVSLG